MKIYIGHSSNLEYEEELYEPLKNSVLEKVHRMIFPHESTEFSNSKKFLKNDCDLFIAEVSRASTGLGIELGWADQFDVPIICVCYKDAQPSEALKTVTGSIIRYKNKNELVEKLDRKIPEL